MPDNGILIEEDSSNVTIKVNQGELNVGGRYRKVAPADFVYNVEVDDAILGVSSLNEPVTLFLPDVKLVDPGSILIIKDETGFADESNINIMAFSGQQIDSEISYTIDTSFGYVKLYSEGNTGDGNGRWFVIT